ISGALTTQGDATIGTSNRNDGAGGGTTAGGAIVNVNANSIAVNGLLDGFVSANGGQIGGTGAVVFNAGAHLRPARLARTRLLISPPAILQATRSLKLICSTTAAATFMAMPWKR
ncbi:MAG: hypothetical protein DMF13_10230, partial [Verrucomicrobia bacterium]